MIYVFNKNKINSYILASCFVLTLFIFYDNITPNRDVELIKVSSNVVKNSDTNNFNDANNAENNN